MQVTKKSAKGVSLHAVRMIWREANEAVFGGVLPEPIIRITRARKYYGTCVRRESDGGKRLAIYISGPLNRGNVSGLRDTVIHEMIHQWQYENGYTYNQHDETFTQWLPVVKERMGIELGNSWDE